MNSEDHLARLLRTPLIIWAALTSGLLGFGIVAQMILTMSPPGAAGSADMLLLVCGILALSSLVMYPLLRGIITRSVRRQWEANPGNDDPTEDLFQRWMAIWLMGVAMTEGAALFAVVIYMITGHALAIALAGAGWLILAAQIPRQGSVRRFVRAITGQAW